MTTLIIFTLKAWGQRTQRVNCEPKDRDWRSTGSPRAQWPKMSVLGKSRGRRQLQNAAQIRKENERSNMLGVPPTRGHFALWD